MLKEKKSVGNTPFHVLDGFKPLHGSSYLEAGYIFAPYVPLQVTPVINFEPIRIGFQNSNMDYCRQVQVGDLIDLCQLEFDLLFEPGCIELKPTNYLLNDFIKEFGSTSGTVIRIVNFSTKKIEMHVLVGSKSTRIKLSTFGKEKIL